MNAHNFFDIRALTYAVGRAVLSAPSPGWPTLIMITAIRRTLVFCIRGSYSGKPNANTFAPETIAMNCCPPTP